MGRAARDAHLRIAGGDAADSGLPDGRGASGGNAAYRGASAGTGDRPGRPAAAVWRHGPLAAWTWLPGAAQEADPVPGLPDPQGGPSRLGTVTPAGDPPLAVLVHGIGSSWRTWWRIGPALAARGWQVVAVELPGHGDSPRLGAATDLDVLAAALDETLPGRPVDLLVGHSLGALTVMTLLAGVPDRARRVVLEDPPALDGADWAEIAEQLQVDLERARADRDGLRAELLTRGEPVAEAEVDHHLETLVRLEEPVVLDALRQPPQYDIVQLAAALPPLPVLVFLGRVEHGSALPAATRLPLVSALAHGWVEVLDCGHRVHRSEFDSFMRRLDAWLDRVGAPRPDIPTRPSAD